jgi:hypothetical protein
MALKTNKVRIKYLNNINIRIFNFLALFFIGVPPFKVRLYFKRLFIIKIISLFRLNI